MDSKYTYNLGLFLVNYFIVCYLSYSYLTRHIFHKNPLFFTILLGVVGMLMTIAIVKVKIIIPIKIFLINTFSSYTAFLVFYVVYDNCAGVECDKSYIDHISIIIHLFTILKFYISIIVITILYFAYKIYLNKSSVN